MKTPETSFPYELESCLVVPLHENISAVIANSLKAEVMTILKQKGMYDVIFDMASVTIMDRKTFKRVHEIAKMVVLMGGHILYSGITPSVATIIVDMEIETDDITTAFSIKEGIIFLQKCR